MAHSEWEDAVRRRRIVVTGGAGFIGSHLVRALLAAGAAHVRVIDDLHCGDQANLGDSDVELVRVRLGWDDPTPHLAGADVLMHLAAEKHNQALDRPADLLRANVEGTQRVLEAAVRHGIGRVVFTSSLYAYGRLTGPPCTETERPEPTTVYGISKLAGEHLLAPFRRRNGLSGAILRYYFVYGPRQLAGMGYKSVIVKNFERLLAGQPPRDLRRRHPGARLRLRRRRGRRAMRALTPAAHGQTFNVGLRHGRHRARPRPHHDGGRRRRGRATFEPADWTAGTWRSGSPARIAKVLGWRARTDLPTGLRRTLDWMREQRG